MKYKAGDKIKVKENFWEIQSKVYINDNMKKLAGRTLEVKSVYGYGDVHTKQDDSNDSTAWTWDKDWVEIYRPTITWDNLKWKDVLIDKVGDERMVLRVENDLVDMSFADNFNKYLTTYHKEELQKNGYTIKQATPTPVTPITIEIGGIKYNKDEVENALKDLKAQG